MTTTAPKPALAVGSVAPDFTLDSTSGSPFTLSSLRGGKHALLCFFPLAFTSTCTAEMCELSEDFDRFASHKVDVLPISVDSVPTLKEFKAKHGLKVDLLSDFKRAVSRAYDVLIDERYYSKRAYFLVGKDGRIEWMHIEETPSHKRPIEELLERIAHLS